MYSVMQHQTLLKDVHFSHCVRVDLQVVLHAPHMKYAAIAAHGQTTCLQSLRLTTIFEKSLMLHYTIHGQHFTSDHSLVPRTSTMSCIQDWDNNLHEWRKGAWINFCMGLKPVTFGFMLLLPSELISHLLQVHVVTSLSIRALPSTLYNTCSYMSMNQLSI